MSSRTEASRQDVVAVQDTTRPGLYRGRAFDMNLTALEGRGAHPRGHATPVWRSSRLFRSVKGFEEALRSAMHGRVFVQPPVPLFTFPFPIIMCFLHFLSPEQQHCSNPYTSPQRAGPGFKALSDSDKARTEIYRFV